ncbi:MAG: type II toxin-antitoxin system HicA family toxin [Deltaproteobacteria bacterium]|nr:type II toxin-antitoxin system HicA family toxin [Deltaproteobacteria bacterium]
MPKIPRDISGQKLAGILKKYEYEVTRQTGGHLRLVSRWKKNEHKITIPNHSPIKIGTLNNILSDLSEYLKIDKEILIDDLFRK